jgi:hypothetical protein
VGSFLNLDRKEGRARVERLANELYGLVRRSLFFDVALLVVTLLVTLTTALVTRSGELTATAAILGTAVAGSFSWSWLGDTQRQAAFEVLMDHAVREPRLWAETTGTKLPTTARGAERWLRDHAGAPGTAAMLARLGRFEEARTAARAATIETPEDEFARELIERQLDLYEGERPDTTALHESWRRLPPGPVRDLRRWCIAIADAQQVVDDGHDGWPVLTAARGDVTSVHERASAKAYARNLAILHVGLAAGIWSIAAWAIL